MDKFARLRLTKSSSGDTQNMKTSISHILGSPRKHFSRSKSKEKISEASDVISPRKRARKEAPKSEIRFKSEGVLIEQLQSYSERDSVNSAGPFVLRATGVNSMPNP